MKQQNHGRLKSNEREPKKGYRKTAIAFLNNIQLSNTYAANNGNLTKTTYGNGAYIENVYDVLDRIVQIKYNGSIKYKYAYNGNGDFTSLNLYAYCGNNPVARSDDSVEFWNFVIGGAAGGVIAYNAAKQEGATGKDLALETAKADNPTKRANERGFALQ